MTRFGIGTLAFFLFSASNPPIAQDFQVSSSGQVLAASNGRYVFGQVSSFRRDQYLLDTQTGRLWQIVEDEEHRNKLQPVPFVQALGDEAFIPDPLEEVETLRKAVREMNVKKELDSLKKRQESEKDKK